jgi:hypothetical protein
MIDEASLPVYEIEYLAALALGHLPGVNNFQDLTFIPPFLNPKSFLEPPTLSEMIHNF